MSVLQKSGEKGVLTGVTEIKRYSTSPAIKANSGKSYLSLGDAGFILPYKETSNSYHAVKKAGGTDKDFSGFFVSTNESSDYGFLIWQGFLSFAGTDSGKTQGNSLALSFEDLPIEPMDYLVRPISLIVTSGGSSDATYHNRVAYLGNVYSSFNSTITLSFKAYFSESAKVAVTLALIKQSESFKSTPQATSDWYATRAAFTGGRVSLTLNKSDTGILVYRTADTFNGLASASFVEVPVNEVSSIAVKAESSSDSWIQYYFKYDKGMNLLSSGSRIIAKKSGTNDCAPEVTVTTSNISSTGSFTLSVRNPSSKDAYLTMYLTDFGITAGGVGHKVVTGEKVSANSTYTYTGTLKDKFSENSYIMVFLWPQDGSEDSTEYAFRVGDIAISA